MAAVKKIRTQPVTCDAVEYTDGNATEVAEITALAGEGNVRSGPEGTAVLEADSGTWHKLGPGWHVLRRPAGQHSVMSPAAFRHCWENDEQDC
jgi:hypothetical protein